MQRSGKEDLDAAGPVKSPWPFPSKLLWGVKVKNPAASPGRLRLQAEQTSTLPSPPGASHGGLLQEKAVTGQTSRCPQPCGLRLQQDSDSQKTPPSASTSSAGGWWWWGGDMLPRGHWEQTDAALTSYHDNPRTDGMEGISPLAGL